jgi:hypothetical protein
MKIDDNSLPRFAADKVAVQLSKGVQKGYSRSSWTDPDRCDTEHLHRMAEQKLAEKDYDSAMTYCAMLSARERNKEAS